VIKIQIQNPHNPQDHHPLHLDLSQGQKVSQVIEIHHHHHQRNKKRVVTAKYMSIAVFRTDYVTNCAASTSVRYDRKEARKGTAYICGTLWPMLRRAN
jgi:hypothetical protein